jgi:hypothetical protein
MVLGNRAAKLGSDTGEESESSTEIDETYRHQVLDLFAEEEAADYAPTGPVDQAERIGIDYDRRRLQRFGDRARALARRTKGGLEGSRAGRDHSSPSLG